MENPKRIIHLDDVNPKQSKSKKRKSLFVFIFIIIVVFLIFLGLGIAGKKDTFTIKSYTTAKVVKDSFITSTDASGTVVLPTQLEIVSPEDGYSKILFVEEGSVVKPTDVLIEIDVPDLVDDQNLLLVKLEQAKIELENLENTYVFNIAQLNRSILRLKEDVSEAEEDLVTMQGLLELNSSRLSDYEDEEDTLKAVQEELEDTESDLESAIISKAIALRKQQAAIDQYDLELRIIKEDLETVKIKSPIAGEILSINEDLYIPGSVIEQADSLFVVADRSNVYIDFDVYEQYVGLLEIGGKMNVTIGTNTMTAEIIKIGKIATMDSDGLSAMISVRAKPLTDLSLTPGASAVASITLDKKENVILLPRGAWLTTGNQKYVFVLQGKKAYRQEIVFGEIQGSNVEILSGLEDGDEVITSSYQTYIDQTEIDVK